MRQFFLAGLAALLLSPAFAQDPPLLGIGFVQAEEGTWLCLNADPGEALSCAHEHCLEEGAGQECLPTAWCFPALWSGVMTVWLPDFHGARVLCGMDDEDSLEAMLAAFCLTQKEATHCDLTLTVDPQGHEREVTDVSFAGGGAPAETEAPAPDAPIDTTQNEKPAPEAKP